MRWREEVLLLQEEKRRTITSLEKYAEEWDSRATGTGRVVECPLLKQGMEAYAHEQAAGRRSLAQKFLRLWSQESRSAARRRAQELSSGLQGNSASTAVRTHATPAIPATMPSTPAGPSHGINPPLLLPEDPQDDALQSHITRGDSMDLSVSHAQSPSTDVLDLFEGDGAGQEDNSEDVGREKETDEHGLGLQRATVADDSDED